MSSLTPNTDVSCDTCFDPTKRGFFNGTWRPLLLAFLVVMGVSAERREVSGGKVRSWRGVAEVDDKEEMSAAKVSVAVVSELSWRIPQLRRREWTSSARSGRGFEMEYGPLEWP
jgi:hypothetical protein